MSDGPFGYKRGMPATLDAHGHVYWPDPDLVAPPTDTTHRQWIEPEPVKPMPWIYEQSDPALMLFTACLDRFQMTFPSNSHILELGCAESDWLERMHAIDKSFVLTGVDARHQERPAHGFTLRTGDACDVTLFEPETFDRIVLLGALEHFGLSFYGDPDHEHGDTDCMRAVERWLKPGGFVYFDVPCNPTYSIRPNRHFRTYAPASVQERLIVPGLVEINRAYSLPEPNAGTWCHEPTGHLEPYHFVAVLAQKR